MRTSTPKALCLFLFLCLALPGVAWSLELGLPLACGMDRDCFIQQYVDLDPGPGAVDYRCGTLTYDGHKGTDFRVPYEGLRRGVVVRAAADGVVKGVRDGMDDVNVRRIGKAAVKNREAGNGVLLDHGDGWETQYNHLRKGSVQVRPGERVKAGDVLGLVGMSGMTEFPHLELAVRHNGRTFCPFLGGEPGQGCRGEAHPIWNGRARSTLGYVPAGIVALGFASVAPTMEQVLAGEHGSLTLDPQSDALVFWVLAYGVREGDQVEIRVTGPDGREFTAYRGKVDRTQAQRFRFVGKKRKTAPWPPGQYRGTYVLVRDTDSASVRLIQEDATARVQ